MTNDEALRLPLSRPIDDPQKAYKETEGAVILMAFGVRVLRSPHSVIASVDRLRVDGAAARSRSETSPGISAWRWQGRTKTVWNDRLAIVRSSCCTHATSRGCPTRS